MAGQQLARDVSLAKVHTRFARASFEAACLRLACPRRGQALKRSLERLRLVSE